MSSRKLLLGGRAGDILGRRRVFIIGILLFGLAYVLNVDGFGGQALKIAKYKSFARQAGEFRLQIDGRVIGEEEAVEACIGRGERDDLQDRRRILLHDHALRLPGVWPPGAAYVLHYQLVT